MSEIVVVVFLSLLIVMLIAVIALICFNLYEIFNEPGIEKRMRRLRKNRQPWVTVLVYAHNDAATINQTIDALLKSRYTNYDVVVVNDRSKDDTQRIAQQCISRQQNRALKLLNRRAVGTAQQAQEAGYRISRKGGVVISLRAGTLVPKDCIKRAVATHNDSKRTTLRIDKQTTQKNLSELVDSLSDALWLSKHTMYVSDPKNINAVPLPVRPDAITVLLLIFILCVSTITREATIIWYSWVIVTAYLCAVIVLNPKMLKAKIVLLFSTPSAFFLIPVSTFIQAISQFRSRN